jgi:hypothetical protein
LIPGDDDALVQKSFVGLMVSYMNGFTKLQNFHVVVQSFDISSWQVAMDEEYASLLKNGT